MGNEPSEGYHLKVTLTSENWTRDAQAVLEDCLKNRDETKFVECMKKIQGEIFPCLAENLLTIFAQHNWQKAVRAILDRFEKKPGQETHLYLSVMRKAAHTAVQNGHHVILGELLNVEPEISHHLILSVCLKLGEPRKRGVNDTLLRSNLKTCLELILKQINVDVCCIDIAEISSVLSAYFDDCLKKIRNQTNEDVIEYDYRCLMSHNIFSKQNTTYRGTCETEVFLDIARNKNLNHLLKHPLLSSFLYQKWCKIRHILYTNIAFYGIFYFLLNTYILNMIYESSPNENGTQTVNDSLNSTLLIRFYPESPVLSSPIQSILWIFVIVLWLLFTIWEILLFACCPRYFMNRENQLQVVLIIFTLILFCGAGAWSRVVVVLLSALVLTALISQHPKISTNFEMCLIISRNYVRLLLQCLVLIIAFFYIFFLSNPGDPFFIMLIMVFTGKFNSNDILVNSRTVLSYIVIVLFTFFIFLVTVINGPAVSITKENRSEAELNGLISRIRLIVYLENIAFGKPFSWLNWFSRGNSCLLRWNPFRNRIFLFPHYLENGKITFFAHADVIYSNSVNCNKLSPSLKMDPDINKKAERIISDKNQLLDNKEIKIALNKQQEKLTEIEDNLKSLFELFEHFRFNK
ncbi:uncharacterized protein [Temnothorax nylanderi]|uniref:uncharacterized protein n=1 Tax=Temnothorax nylanderi TaxID=102681 RepID=UPI003A84AAAA